jgi:hypothetical protein
MIMFDISALIAVALNEPEVDACAATEGRSPAYRVG